MAILPQRHLAEHFNVSTGLPLRQEKGNIIKNIPPISFKLTITGTEELTYRIEERSAFEVAGVSMLLDKSLEKIFVLFHSFGITLYRMVLLQNLIP